MWIIFSGADQKNRGHRGQVVSNLELVFFVGGGGGGALREIQKTAARESNLEQYVQNSRLKVAVHYVPVLEKCLESLMHLLLMITREWKQEQRSDDDARTTIVSQIGSSFHRSFFNQSKRQNPGYCDLNCELKAIEAAASKG